MALVLDWKRVACSLWVGVGLAGLKMERGVDR